MLAWMSIPPGLRVETCGKPYVSEWFLIECKQRGIQCVYGSDAHNPTHLGIGWDWFSELVVE
ncbi:MAG: PHP-associated domain-containing protein [Bacillota bacterium]